MDLASVQRAAREVVFTFEPLHPDAQRISDAGYPNLTRLSVLLGRKATVDDIKNINLRHPGCKVSKELMKQMARGHSFSGREQRDYYQELAFILWGELRRLSNQMLSARHGRDLLLEERDAQTTPQIQTASPARVNGRPAEASSHRRSTQQPEVPAKLVEYTDSEDESETSEDQALSDTASRDRREGSYEVNGSGDSCRRTNQGIALPRTEQTERDEDVDSDHSDDFVEDDDSAITYDSSDDEEIQGGPYDASPQGGANGDLNISLMKTRSMRKAAVTNGESRKRMEESSADDDNSDDERPHKQQRRVDDRDSPAQPGDTPPVAAPSQALAPPTASASFPTNPPAPPPIPNSPEESDIPVPVGVYIYNPNPASIFTNPFVGHFILILAQDRTSSQNHIANACLATAVSHSLRDEDAINIAQVFYLTKKGSWTSINTKKQLKQLVRGYTGQVKKEMDKEEGEREPVKVAFRCVLYVEEESEGVIEAIKGDMLESIGEGALPEIEGEE